MKRRTRMFSPIVAIVLVDQVADVCARVAEGLLVQARPAVPLLELALDDLGADVLRLLLDGLVGEQLGLLGLEVRRPGCGSMVDVQRREAGDLDGEVADELLELLGARDEVGLAVDLDEHADAAAGVDVAGDEALAGVATGLLGRRGQAALAQQRDRLVEVAVRLGQRLLAVHEPGAGPLAQFLDQLRRDVRHESACSCSFAVARAHRVRPWVGWCRPVASALRRSRSAASTRDRPGGPAAVSPRGVLGLLGRFAGEFGGDLLGAGLGAARRRPLQLGRRGRRAAGRPRRHRARR